MNLILAYLNKDGVIMIKKNIKLSIVTVSFNAEQTIENTIQSVLNQTYNNIEYIIIDGDSKDKTVDIIKKFY